MGIRFLILIWYKNKPYLQVTKLCAIQMFYMYVCSICIYM